MRLRTVSFLAFILALPLAACDSGGDASASLGGTYVGVAGDPARLAYEFSLVLSETGSGAFSVSSGTLTTIVPGSRIPIPVVGVGTYTPPAITFTLDGRDNTPESSITFGPFTGTVSADGETITLAPDGDQLRRQ